MSKRYKQLRRARYLHSKDCVIGEMPRDGRNWECQCARCGSSLEFESCGRCDGEGITAPGELYEEDPLWYDMDDYAPCHECDGKGSFPVCISSVKWCLEHALPGRGRIARHTPEWFTFDAPKGEKLPA